MSRTMTTLATSFMLTAACALMVAGCQAKAADEKAKPTTQEKQKTIIETLKSLPECSEFLQCAERTGVVKELEKSNAMTVLVPTNAAYKNMSSELRNEFRDNENKEKSFCRFHVLKGNLSLQGLMTTGEIETFCDEKGDTTMNFREVTQASDDIINREIPCSNGRIYLINSVLVPDCCKKGFVEKSEEIISDGVSGLGRGVRETSKWITEGVKTTGETVGHGAKAAYDGSREAIGHGMQDAGKGLQKAGDYVAPSLKPATPKK